MHPAVDVEDNADLIDEDPPPSTIPTAGSADLEVEDHMDALFLSATWTLVARVKDNRGTLVLQRSTESNKAHSEAFKKRWTRQFIRQNKARLRRLGVDVESTYKAWGGILEDLE